MTTNSCTPAAPFARTVAVLLIATLLSACHVQRRVALPSDPPVPVATATSSVAVKAGDEVRIVLRDGTLAAAKVVEVRSGELVAERGRRYPFAEMASLEIRKVGIGKSVGMTAAVIGGVMAVFTVLMAAAGWELQY